MGQDEVGLEVIPPPPGYSTSNQHENFVMPTSFTIHKKGDSEVKFNIRGNTGSTPLSIACTYKNTEDDFEARVNLLPRKDENASPLATVTYSRHSAELEFTNTSPPSHITMYYRLLGDRNATHTFNVNTPQRTGFEWRNLGDGEGWKLYIGSKPEVLAIGALNMGSDKPTRFEFTDVQMAKHEVDSDQLKKRVKELEAENRNFRALFESLKEPDAGTSQEILERIQAGDELQTVVKDARGLLGKRKRSPGPTTMSSQRPSDWTTCRGISPRNPNTSPTAVNPVVLPLQASTRSLPPTPLASPPIHTVLLNEARAKEYCDPRLNDLSVSYLTRVPISNQSAATLISTFLETYNFTAGFIDGNLFVTDLVQHNSTFYSAFLVSSILFLVRVTHAASDYRAATLAQSFFNYSKQLPRRKAT
ncbi:uncharacterized protein BKA55DRAFT_685962 [Fusarium redolens]|uniref:Uncharacterized protein n=1 Tax=Fusarium redolens TaxID=48865 RepID=A0A9P9KNT0_FUSRE|nr:uncharacterized protein BKA55DRAFT_685962 [Fusarium redolens]KAH7265496.1 hypothetical protein BKA55DRAFT_685962 [Fusarium redolens]